MMIITSPITCTCCHDTIADCMIIINIPTPGLHLAILALKKIREPAGNKAKVGSVIYTMCTISISCHLANHGMAISAIIITKL